MSYRNTAAAILLILLCACSRDEPVTATTPSQPREQAAAMPEVAESPHAAGREIYDYWCLPCHGAGPGHAGTMALAQRLGSEQSVLLERDNLPAEYVKFVVRNGLQMMPPLMPTEITDAGLESLALYVASVGKPDK